MTLKTATSYQFCRFDFIHHEVTTSYDPDSMVDHDHSAAEAIADQMEIDGWRDGACPPCAIRYAACLHSEHNADQDREIERSL